MNPGKLTKARARFLANRTDDYALRETNYRAGKASRLYRAAEPDTQAEATHNNDDAFDSDFEPSPNWLGGLFLAVAFALGWACRCLWATLTGGH